MRKIQSFTPEALITDEALNRWVERVHQGFLDVGWVQTADTGQLEVATFVVATADTLVGYRVYEINDAYSSDTPVYVKIHFYLLSSNTTASLNGYAPFVGFQVGFATDGAGNFDGGFGPIDAKFSTFGTVMGGGYIINDNAVSAFTKQSSFTGAAIDIRYGAHGYGLFGGCAFFIERVKFNGEVIPTEVVYTYGSYRTTANIQATMLYGRVSRGGSSTGPYSNPSHLPRVGSDSYGRVATRFDLSTELYAFESDNLIALRDGADMGEVELTFDGVTSKRYLTLKSSRISGSGSFNKATLEASGGVLSRMDSREVSVGFLGIAWDE